MRCRLVYFRAKLALVIVLLLSCWACGQSRKLADIHKRELVPHLSLPPSEALPQLDSSLGYKSGDTLRVTGLDGRELLIMRAIKDEETGEMVATEQLHAAVVTARFRNVAERGGKINLEFQVSVPPAMHDSHWQLRLHPVMTMLGESVKLEDVVITGADYRKAQIRGYQQYERFVRRIVSDTTLFIQRRALEIFLERNLPELYAFKSDSSWVSDEAFASVYGITQQEAVEHYTNQFAKRLNNWRKSRREAVWRHYVKSPIISEGIRLDTVIKTIDGSFEYNYSQTINTRPGLRRLEMRLDGEIFEADKRIYSIPQSDALTYYVSSLSSFVDGTPRYKTIIVSRSVSSNTTAMIDFRQGSSEMEESLSDNPKEIASVKRTLLGLLSNDSFEMDSIIITAFASPEGPVKANNALSYRRAASVSNYFERYLYHIKDSLKREQGLFLSLGDDSYEEDNKAESASKGSKTNVPEGDLRSSIRPNQDLSFLSRSGGEDWSSLDALVADDKELKDEEKDSYQRLSTIMDLDTREKTLAAQPYYKRISTTLYPRLRRVRLDFHLHRKGMQKDTLHTSVLDSLYMSGVQALRDHDYDKALEVLGSYSDYNTAVAYVAKDRNHSALSILETCKRNANVNYMLALVYQRLGDERAAVESYIRSCEQEASYVHRGNLDPEIASLIQKYNLNSEQ